MTAHVSRRRPVVIDLFAGGGGASEGIRRALGRCPVVAVNHDPAAIMMHAANHPSTLHLTESVFATKPKTAAAGREVDLLWASPDCFPAGTLVLTESGYRPIEEVRVGDMVLTHRGRWRPVTSLLSSSKPTFEVRGHGHHGLRVSGEHPFWTRTRQKRRVRQSPVGTSRTETTWAEPRWTKADELMVGHYWACPLRLEPLAVPWIVGRSLPLDERLWWLVGRYLADGWTRLTDDRAELVITCGLHEVEGLRPLLNRWPRAGRRAATGELAWHERETSTAYQFTTNHRGLVGWLRSEFGHLAYGKTLPGWVYGMPAEHRRALLDGYISGDGWDHGDFVEATTVSRPLAFGVRTLAASLGHVPAVYRRANSDVIQGRSVEARDAYQLRWRHQVADAHAQHHADDLHLFTPIRAVGTPGPAEPVFNLSVADDESYVVEGVVVHNCTHFSKAKGGKPRSKEIRSLAWVVVDWAREVQPRVIMLENVREILGWGPLDQNDQPIKARAGETWREFVAALEGAGYRVEWRVLKAADYGAPTTRERLFLVARRDGLPIQWPEPSHGPGRAHPWRSAAECIDWSIPCPSIFERKKPLADATQKRIAEGLRRYVLGPKARPFLVGLTHGGRLYDAEEPLRTITTANGGEFAAVSPVVAPVLVQSGYGEREGQAPRVLDIGAPLGTVVAGGAKHALVAAFLAKHYGGVVGQDLERPLGTVTAIDHHSLVAAHLTKYYGSARAGSPVTDPLPTVTAGGGRGGGKAALVAAFLTKWYSGGGTSQAVDRPLDTIVAKARFGLVTVDIAGEPWAVVDIGLRMLAPRELARAQGFPDSYVLTGTKAQQIERIGNSVCPPVVEALVRANFHGVEMPAVQPMLWEAA